MRWRARSVVAVLSVGVFACASGCSRESVEATVPSPVAAAQAPATATAVEGARLPDAPPAEVPFGPQVTETLDAAGGTALAARILAAIEGDPRITSRDIEVGYEPARPFSPEMVTIHGTAASDDERIAAMNHIYRLTDLGISGSLNVVSDDSADETPIGPWTAPSAAAPVVPLCAGLTVVTAVSSQGDYESIKTIESVTANAIRVRYSSQPNPPWWTGFNSATPETMTTHRTVLKGDLDAARQYNQIFVTTHRAPETAPGTTAIGTSAAVLRELKATGTSELSLCGSADDVEIRDDKGNVRQAPGGCLSSTGPIPLRRLGTAPTALRVLVNGTPTDLPAVHARGGRAEFFFLDDDSNPLTLAFRLGIGAVPALRPSTRALCEKARRGEGFFVMTGDPPPSCDLPDGGDRDSLRVISISTRCDTTTLATGAPAGAGKHPAASGVPSGSGPGGGGGGGSGAASGGTGGGAGPAEAIEKALASRGTVDVYSIYFSFNSDLLREESEPTLGDIAAVLARNPDWNLGVNGHTDGVGTSAFNFDLSRRRAAAVKAALVERYGIDARRLDTSGLGESRPKDTNETLEGRASNRRVELVKVS